jgi:3-deoxy-D-manno-octulosonic-acid transferase
MLIIYRLLINFIFFISPIVIIFRLIRKKESFLRFKEKYCYFSQKRNIGKVVWFHGASVGEIKSVIPLIEKITKDTKIKQILITSNTLSSSKIIKSIKSKKIIHQFFPIDTNFLTKRFIKYWKPSVAFFIDSEIWPNMFCNLNKTKIPIILINARITKKTFKRWKKIEVLATTLFGYIDLCLTSNKESINYLKKLGSKKIKFIGNLKYAQSEKEVFKLNKRFTHSIFGRKIWCASSTHNLEEEFCGKVHKLLKASYKNLLTVIIPRHIERTNNIIEKLNNQNLNIQILSNTKFINRETDILIVNAYGKTKHFFSIIKDVFLGGSLIKHGGQNPLEAARFGCNIYHGPNIYNFNEIYKFLNNQKISKKIKNINSLVKELKLNLSKKSNPKKLIKKIDVLGKRILNSTFNELKIYL